MGELPTEMYSNGLSNDMLTFDYYSLGSNAHCQVIEKNKILFQMFFYFGDIFLSLILN